MTPNPDPIAQLEALARNATKGPWISPDVEDNCVTREDGTYITDNPDAWPLPENTKFIAAANPQAILALIGRLRKAGAVVEAARAVYEADDVFTEVDGDTHLRDGALGDALAAYDDKETGK